MPSKPEDMLGRTPYVGDIIAFNEGGTHCLFIGEIMEIEKGQITVKIIKVSNERYYKNWISSKRTLTGHQSYMLNQRKPVYL